MILIKIRKTTMRWITAVAIVFYLISEWMMTLPVSLLWLKYIAFAMTLFMLSVIITQRFARHSIHGKIGIWVKQAAILILLIYVWLCLDTFLLGMRLPVSGMIRYAIFDFTLPLSVLFIVAGILYGASMPKNNDIRR